MLFVFKLRKRLTLAIVGSFRLVFILNNSGHISIILNIIKELVTYLKAYRKVRL